ncbi:hypothetical protein BS78_K150800 [Paspalum vaginatum]|uniref:Uncharacterized protein n=1 Tax=Paspalum vaginatum TaxID=158149 RepID=A0A9W7X6A7_9POAL|nr:hypothetical protein BS78_K150800 [Paspalum vaginatum]
MTAPGASTTSWDEDQQQRMAASLTPSIIVLALGAGALGFPGALRLLLLRDVAGRRSPLLDIALCAVAMAALTAYALGAVLLARFVRKAGPGAGAGAGGRARPTDPFALLTLAVSLGAAAAAALVLACLLVAEPGARGLSLLCRRIVADVVGESQGAVVVSVLVAVAGAVLLPCTARQRPLLRAAPASSPTARLSIATTALVSFASIACLLLVVATTYTTSHEREANGAEY